VQNMNKTLNGERRRQEERRIHKENQFMLKRMQEKKSEYDISKFQRERERTEKLIKKICEYPESIHTIEANHIKLPQMNNTMRSSRFFPDMSPNSALSEIEMFSTQRSRYGYNEDEEQRSRLRSFDPARDSKYKITDNEVCMSLELASLKSSEGHPQRDMSLPGIGCSTPTNKSNIRKLRPLDAKALDIDKDRIVYYKRAHNIDGTNFFIEISRNAKKLFILGFEMDRKGSKPHLIELSEKQAVKYLKDCDRDFNKMIMKLYCVHGKLQLDLFGTSKAIKFKEYSDLNFSLNDIPDYGLDEKIVQNENRTGYIQKNATLPPPFSKVQFKIPYQGRVIKIEE